MNSSRTMKVLQFLCPLNLQWNKSYRVFLITKSCNKLQIHDHPSDPGALFSGEVAWRVLWVLSLRWSLKDHYTKNRPVFQEAKIHSHQTDQRRTSFSDVSTRLHGFLRTCEILHVLRFVMWWRALDGWPKKLTTARGNLMNSYCTYK